MWGEAVKRYPWVVIVSMGVGLSLGIWMCVVALDHNPQGEFRDLQTGAVHWDSLGPIIAFWGIAGAATTAFLLLLSWGLLRGLGFVIRIGSCPRV